MAFTTDTLARAAFKRMLSLSHTSDTANVKDPGNESIASTYTLSSNFIFAEEIPGTAAAVAGRIIACTNVSAGQPDSELVLHLHTASNGAAYMVQIPTGHALLDVVNPRSASGSNYIVSTPNDDDDRVSFIIPKSFGSTWRPILKDNGTEVTVTAANDWFLDENAGVVVSESDLNLSTTGTLNCYVYIGETVFDRINVGDFISIDVSNDVNISGDIILGGSLSGGSGGVLIDDDLSITGNVNIAGCLTGAGSDGLCIDDNVSISGSTFVDDNLIVANTIDASNLTLGATTTVNAILDEDAMGSDSATSLATQQSIKAYVDSQAHTADQNLFETISCPTGSNPVADTTTDTLALTSNAHLIITGNNITDSVNFFVVTGNSGTAIPLLDGNNIYSGSAEFTSTVLINQTLSCNDVNISGDIILGGSLSGGSGGVLIDDDLSITGNVNIAGCLTGAGSDGLCIDDNVSISGSTFVDDNLIVDNIVESTTDAGVTIEGVLIKDGLTDGIDLATNAATAAANLTDNALLSGDGGAKGIQDSPATVTDAGVLAAPSAILSQAGDPATPTEGEFWFNTVDGVSRMETAQGAANISGVLAVLVTLHKITNTSSETAFNVSHTIPASSVEQGKVFRLYAAGILSTDATIDYTWRIKVGSTVFLSNLETITAITNSLWFFEGTFTAGTFFLGNWAFFVNGSMGSSLDEYVNLGNIGAVAIADAATHDIQLTIQMSAAGTGKHISCQQLIIQEVA